MSKPKFKVHDVRVGNMSTEDYKQCKRLGYRDGCIREDLEKIRTRGYRSKSRAVMVKDDKGRIRSWGLIDYYNGYLGEDRGKPMVQLWTQRRWRRKGLGSLVMGRIKRLIGDKFSHYEEQAPEFFESVGAKQPYD